MGSCQVCLLVGCTWVIKLCSVTTSPSADWPLDQLADPTALPKGSEITGLNAAIVDERERGRAGRHGTACIKVFIQCILPYPQVPPPHSLSYDKRGIFCVLKVKKMTICPSISWLCCSFCHSNMIMCHLNESLEKLAILLSHRGG